MTPEQQTIADALRELCWRAGVSPDDGSPFAGNRVRELVRSELVRPWDVVMCGLNQWIEDRFPELRALVTTEHVVLPTVVLRVVRSTERDRKARMRVFATVDLPLAVRSAVRVFDKKGVA